MANTAVLAVAISARGAVQGARQYNTAIKQMIAGTHGASGAMAGMRGVALRLFAAVGGYMVFRKMTSTIMDFEDTMARLQGVTSATTDEMERFNSVARELGATTRFTATQAGEGLLNLSRAGFTVNESVAAIEATLNLASGAMLELGEASSFVANSIRQFRLGADEAGRVTDVLTNTANKSNTTVRELADGMNYAGVIAAQVGMSIEETAAAMGVMADAGLRGSKSGMGLRQVLADLLAPSTNAVKVLKELGLTYDQIDPQKVGLVPALQALKDAGMDTGQAFRIFGARAATAALAMSQNIEKINQLTDANREAEGVAKRNADLINNTLRGAYLQLISTLQEVTLMIGERGFTNALKTAVQNITQFIRVLAGIKTESAEVSDGVLRAVIMVRKLWDWLVKLKTVFIAIVAIHLSAKLVLMANAMFMFGKATIFAAGGLLKMAAGIAGVLLPALGILATAILAIEFGRWLESLEPVQVAMQNFIWWIAERFQWLKKILNEVWVAMKDLAVRFFINPLINVFSGVFTEIMDLLRKMAVRAKKLTRALGMDEASDKLAKFIGFAIENRTALKEIDLPDLGEEMAKIASDYETELENIKSAHKRALDSIAKHQAGKTEDQTFFDFASADIQKIVDKLGLFKEETSGANDELAKFRAELDAFGKIGVSSTEDLKNEMIGTKAAIAAAGDTARAAMEKIGTDADATKKKVSDFTVSWDDMKGTIGSGITDLILQTKSWNQSIRDVTDSLVQMAVQAAVMRAISGGIAGGGAGGAAVAASGLVAMAAGGVVHGPTAALIGERGPEVVMPLSRDERGRIGVAGGGAEQVTNNFNLISPDSRGIKDMLLRDPKLIRQMNETYKQGYAID